MCVVVIFDDAQWLSAGAAAEPRNFAWAIEEIARTENDRVAVIAGTNAVFHSHHSDPNQFGSFQSASITSDLNLTAHGGTL